MKIEVWSDIVCPFCTIGKARFEKALTGLDFRDEIDITWRSFELDPNADVDYDGTLNEWLSKHKGISISQAAALNDRVAAMATAEGLVFNLDIARVANTFKAHRLTHWAAQEGKRTEMTARLFKAYFQEGESLNDDATLARLAEEAGLSREAATAFLKGSELAQEVRAEEERAIRLGIQGVPFFLVDEKYGISGAQSTETFTQALRQIHSGEA